jgi:hypothetical protein
MTDLTEREGRPAWTVAISDHPRPRWVAARTKSDAKPRMQWRRALLASTAALSLGIQNAAWATCSDGTAFPVGGFVVGSTALPIARNWPTNSATIGARSIFIPDISVNEANDPSKPLTGGGHNWAFDQAETLCKETDTGGPGAVATGWAIPFFAPATACVILPIVTNGKVANLGDIPYQGEAVTPTCDPTLLSSATVPNPANTYFNQLGCSIYHGVKTDAQHATTYLFVAGIKGGLFNIALNNVANPTVGGDAGKIVGPASYYSAIPEAQKLTSAAVSKDGQIAIATSSRKLQTVYACGNPLGDPGDPSKPINANFVVPPASAVSCMQVGSNNLAADLTTAFGPDNQPYFSGQRVGNAQNTVVNSFNGVPGGSSKSAWPNCIWQNNGSTSLADAFAHRRANGCGSAASNATVSSPLISQPSDIVSHGSYMYVGSASGQVVQFKVTADPISGLSTYAFRTYFTSDSPPVTALGVAEDLHSLMVASDPQSVAAVVIGFWTKLPLCEDMP